MSNYYQLTAGDAPWGDYGSILWSGLCDTSKTGDVEIQRTGPFVPPISFPYSGIIVTDEIRLKMEREGFKGLSFVRAEYKKVVRLDWQSWDQRAPEPEKYPAGGEPENYILGRRHRSELLAEMPKLWAFDVPVTQNLQVIGTSTFRENQWPDTDIAREFDIHWIGERMKVWMEGNFSPWIGFATVRPK